MQHDLKFYILSAMQGQMDIDDVPEEYRYYVIRVCSIQDEYQKKLARKERNHERYWLANKLNDIFEKIKNKLKRDYQAEIVYKDK